MAFFLGLDFDVVWWEKKVYEMASCCRVYIDSLAFPIRSHIPLIEIIRDVVALQHLLLHLKYLLLRDWAVGLEHICLL